jgi:predicted nucleic acid-binding protein
MAAEVFLDSAFAIALAAVTDQLHEKAVALAKSIETSGTGIITTQAVFLEIGNALSKQRHRAGGIQLLKSLEADPKVTVISLSPDLYARAFALFQSRLDKEWGLIDCVSFVVMHERGLTEALTSDVHFEQAGFIAMLR